MGNTKLTGSVLLVFGILLALVGVVIMAVIVPGIKQFPDDVDTTRYYEGTMPVLLNAETLEFMTDLDVILERHITTEDTDDGVALVKEEQTLLLKDQEDAPPLLANVYHYSIDRKTMEFDTDYPDTWAEKTGFWDREGLVIGWPIDASDEDAIGWSDNYRSTIDFNYEDEVTYDRTGIDTYYFTASSDAAPIPTEAAVYSGLPTELSHEQIASLVGSMEGVNPMVAAALPRLLEQAEWPDPAPLEFSYEYNAEYWVEPKTGVLIDTHKTEIRRVGFPAERIETLRTEIEALPMELDEALVDQLLSPVIVSYLEYRGTDQSVQEATDDAQDAIDQINLFGQTIPLIAIVVGAVLALIGAYLMTRKTAAAPAA